jgi:histidinol-phosphate/aromatic aminotransferase/cobyric acid decarboxylase-like protein
MSNHFSNCFHGGAFFNAIGEEFDALERRHENINADVLDAWFPPSPRVIAALQEDLPWLLRTSPPTNSDGLIRVIARTRGVSRKCVLPGAGSSDLIFLALRQWLTTKSRALILDPTYSEYAHVLEKLIGCHVDRFTLKREENYRINLLELDKQIQRCRYDLLVLVNPNSPTGQFVPRVDLEKLIRRVPQNTRVWVDETYIEYTGQNESLESFAAVSGNAVVCKSMSKVYALSGARVAYLCGPEQIIAELRELTPPWAVSLPAQIAAVTALQDIDYYAARYKETHRLREKFAAQLSDATQWEIVPGMANFLLAHLPSEGPNAAVLVKHCRAQKLFLRDADGIGQCFGGRAVRVAIKDSATNTRMKEIILQTLQSLKGSRRRGIVSVHRSPQTIAVPSWKINPLRRRRFA